MGNEKFCLRWNEFETNISSALREIRDDKDFFDVTLACDDEQIQAHKVILSACSPFFRNILRRNPHQHPLLYMKGVKYTDLQYVLNFMYHGEVSVAQEELNSFLAVAEDLRVKGLTQNKSPSPGPAQVKVKERQVPPLQKQTEKPLAHSSHTKAPAPPTKSYYNNYGSQTAISSPPVNNTTYDDDIQEVVPVKSEPRDLPTKSTAPAPQSHYSSQNCQSLATAEEQYLAYQDDSYEDYGQYGDQDQGYQYGGAGGQQEASAEEAEGHREQLETCINKIEENGAIFYKCSLCGKTTPRKDALKTHVENIHFPGSYQCHHCDQMFNSKITRNVHVGRKHKFN